MWLDLFSPSWVSACEQLHWNLHFGGVWLFVWAVRDLVITSACSSAGRFAGCRLMLVFPGATAREWRRQQEYRSPGLAYCSAVHSGFQLPISALHIFILWGQRAIEGKKTEVLQRILWTQWYLLIDKAQRYGQYEVSVHGSPALLLGLPAVEACTSPALACTAASSSFADLCWQNVSAQ